MFSRTESLKQYIRYYPITAVLIGINLVIMLLMEWYGSSKDNLTLIQFGAIFDLPGLQPEWWRYVTAMFVHIGFAHLLFNSFALYIFAPALEIMLGKWRYLVLYVVSGIAGNVISKWLHQDHFIGAGASGAIYGIYAAYLFLAVFRKDIIDNQTKQSIIAILAVGVLYSIIVPNVDLYAHLGGFIGGIICMALIVLSIKRRARRRADGQGY
jgi:rhomboid protease GluP